jgi:hypothetical protein
LSGQPIGDYRLTYHFMNSPTRFNNMFQLLVAIVGQSLVNFILNHLQYRNNIELFESPDILVDATNKSEKCWDKHVHLLCIIKCASGEFAIA